MEIRDLIKNIVEDSKHTSQDEDRYTDAPRGVKEVHTPQIKAQLSELTKVVTIFAKDKGVQSTPRPCGICTQVGHPTDMCPQLQEEEYEEANVIGGYSGHNQRTYDQPRGNQGWNNNQSMGYQQRPPPHYQARPPFPQQNYQPRQLQPLPLQARSLSMSLEDTVKSLATSTQSFQQETKASIKNLEQQMAQLAQSVSKMENQGKLPPQTEKNPKHNACAINLRSGKKYDGPKMPEEEREELVIEEPPKKDEKKEEMVEKKKPEEKEAKITLPPFPSRLSNNKKEREDSEIMAMFQKVEVNIPLLDAIRQVPRYAKFLKELCTSKKKLRGNETVKVSENVFAVLQKRMPPKCKDPGVFTVPCKLGNLYVPRAMLDLGASINVLPYSVYKSIGIATLTKTGVIIQLANRSIVHLKDVLEDVLVQVNELVFPTDFYVLDMGDDDHPSSSSILLGRPFLKTARTKFDVYNGTLSMEFDGEVINFNIYEVTRYPSDVHCINFVDIIQPLTEKCFELTNHDLLELVLSMNFDNNSVKEIAENFKLDEELLEIVESMEEKKKMRYDNSNVKLPISNTKLLPSVVQAPKLELKTLPDHSKYAYLGEEKNLPVIISNKLSIAEEDELVTLLKKYKKAIGWTIADIKGLSPSLCMHKILMEEDFKPTREAQRRLNPPMMEVIKKEIMKLLDVVFVDDFTVYGNSFDECLSNLTKILQRCIDTDLVLNYEKCHFMVDKGLILGHIVSRKGLEVDKAKIDVIKSLPYPTNVREPCKDTFDRLKDLLTSAPIIQPPNWDLPFEIMCDASNTTVGAVLGQKVDRAHHVIYYASKTLDGAQCNYTTTEKELLAIVFALEKFRQYLLGTKVIIYSDHAAIKHLLTKKDSNPRLIRWMPLLQEFDIEIKDKSGKENLVADHLSRIVPPEDATPIHDTFSDEHLFAIQTPPWYVDICNFMVTGKFPPDLTRSQRDKIKKDARRYKGLKNSSNEGIPKGSYGLLRA
ncbi:uncharacterized protein LOC128127127 [Lactuca sativa]|uniref:uncharacterized protein LOC128127127 n=1 Tax=Lactuca sativa TaxID=4236 RepID=UPI0022AEADAB|nr:uncharacterized protein LOC128127127 [Lactuca sativa]